MKVSRAEKRLIDSYDPTATAAAAAILGKLLFVFSTGDRAAELLFAQSSDLLDFLAFAYKRVVSQVDLDFELACFR